MNIAVLGSQNGDEGKGHVTHWLSKDYDWVIRFNGGANAGHTIYRDGKKFVHNLLPSVDFRVPTIKGYLGSGMVIDLEKLRDEVSELEKSYPGAAKRIYVDKEAFLVESVHKEEDKASNSHIGSTNRGIGPAYKDKISRKGHRINDLYTGKLHDPYYNDFMYQLAGMDVNFVHQLEMQPAMEKANLLFEGAQGVLLDINHGIYPYVSCSDSTIGGVYASGFGFAKIDTVYGVAKCYTTKVGEGPFPTELFGEDAESLRKLGNEYGATTGRPRRVGWLDLPALKYACQKGGINKLILTKFDILDGMEIVPVCWQYENAPMCPADFFNTVPDFLDILGWTNAKNAVELKPFINEVEYATGIDVAYISCGTSDEDIKKW
jgi:adenylosuccinate synthase